MEGQTRFPLRQTASLVTILILILIGVEIPQRIDGIIEDRGNLSMMEHTSPCLEPAPWLEACVPTSAVILYERYIYIPPSFREVKEPGVGGVTVEILETFNPDLILLHRSTFEVFGSPDKAASFMKGEAAFMERFEFYRGMREESLGFVLKKEFRTILVYEREDYSGDGCDR